MVNQRTLEEYEKAGVKYVTSADDDYLANERGRVSDDLQAQKEGKPNNVNRRINAIYRFRTLRGEEHILYHQDITAQANVTKNRVKWHEAPPETSMYRVPIVERAIKYDQETEKQSTEIKQIQSVETYYTIPFTEEEVMKLNPYTDLGTMFYVSQEQGITRTIDDFEEWLTIPFQYLIEGSHGIQRYYLDQEEERKRQEEKAIEVQEVQPQSQQSKAKVTKP
jgi:hypothetical protein